MSKTEGRDPRPFLSIVKWPDGCDREQTASLLAEMHVLDLATAYLRLGQEPPMVVAQAESDEVAAAIDRVRARGGDAFAFTFEHLEALGPTHKLRRLRITEDGIDAELQRGLSTTLRRQSVQILVRAQLRRTETERREPPKFGSMAWRRTRDSIRAEIESARTERLITSEKLDIHTNDGGVFQVDGDMFDFSVLGDLRGYSDKVNLDSLCELISHIAPDEVVDTYFKLWRPPPGYHHLRVPDMKMSRDDPSFAFYSRWTALTYRHVMHGAG